jgi:hypothetical protein
MAVNNDLIFVMRVSLPKPQHDICVFANRVLTNDVATDDCEFARLIVQKDWVGVKRCLDSIRDEKDIAKVLGKSDRRAVSWYKEIKDAHAQLSSSMDWKDALKMVPWILGALTLLCSLGVLVWIIYPWFDGGLVASPPTCTAKESTLENEVNKLVEQLKVLQDQVNHLKTIEAVSGAQRDEELRMALANFSETSKKTLDDNMQHVTSGIEKCNNSIGVLTGDLASMNWAVQNKKLELENLKKSLMNVSASVNSTQEAQEILREQLSVFGQELEKNNSVLSQAFHGNASKLTFALEFLMNKTQWMEDELNSFRDLMFSTWNIHMILIASMVIAFVVVLSAYYYFFCTLEKVNFEQLDPSHNGLIAALAKRVAALEKEANPGFLTSFYRSWFEPRPNVPPEWEERFKAMEDTVKTLQQQLQQRSCAGRGRAVRSGTTGMGA